MPEQENYTVIAEVTPEQYDMLVAHSISLQLVPPATESLHRAKGCSVPEVIQAVILRSCEDDEHHEDEWSAADNVGMERMDTYNVATSHWPVHIQADLIKRGGTFFNEHVETGAGYEVYFSLDPSDDESKEIIEYYPQLREMFLAEPDVVATWFR